MSEPRLLRDRRHRDRVRDRQVRQAGERLGSSDGRGDHGALHGDGGKLRDVDFLPLTVDVEERMYAAGKIPGSFFSREGRAGEKATLTARMIDRPLRPLFPKGWRARRSSCRSHVGGPRPPLRHPRDERRQRRADGLGHPLPGARRRRAHRQDDEGNFVVNPDEEWLLEYPGSTWWSPAPRRPS